MKENQPAKKKKKPVDSSRSLIVVEMCIRDSYKDEQLRTYIDLAFNKKQQLLAHCNGDAAAEQYVSQFEKELALREDKDIHRAVMVQMCIRDRP